MMSDSKPPESESQSPESDTPNYLASWRLYVVITCLFWGSFLIALDTNIINVALPVISSEFKALEDYAWYGSAYLLTITAFQPIYGSAYKYFRTDVVYRLAIVTFEVGSILCAAAINSNMFIVGRAVAGFGAAGVLQGALSIISQVVPLEKRALYMGVVISVFVITVTIGPVLGGAFTEHATWRWCFWINLPLGAVVLLGLTLFLKIKTPANKDRSLTLKQKLERMDPLGCFLFIAAVCCLVLALQWGGQSKPWRSPDVVGCLVGAGTIGLIFIHVQRRRGDAALIPLRIFKKRSIWTGAMVLLFLGAQVYVNTYFLPLWFQGVRGVSPVITGVDFMPFLVPELVALIFVGILVKQFGFYVPYMVVGELITIGGQAMLIQLRPESSTLYWVASLVVTGLGAGMAMQLPYTAVAIVLEDEDIPVGNAIAVLFYQLGGAVFVAMGQTVTITTLVELVPQLLPDLTPQAVINAGATNLQAIATSPEELTALRFIWNEAVSRAMTLGVGVASASLPFTLGMEWLNAIRVAENRKSSGVIPASGTCELPSMSVTSEVQSPTQENASKRETNVPGGRSKAPLESVQK